MNDFIIDVYVFDDWEHRYKKVGELSFGSIAFPPISSHFIFNNREFEVISYVRIDTDSRYRVLMKEVKAEDCYKNMF